MTNAEKYKTTEERVKAFKEWCQGLCGTCPLERHILNGCGMLWLDLEAEEDKPLPCPFCGSNTVVKSYITVRHVENHVVECSNCQYRSEEKYQRDAVIAAHNRVARAVMEAKESEAK